jgi:site-specific DNA-cytosine methylase
MLVEVLLRLQSQGFSNLNHCPKADDPRNHLVLTFLSAVDMLQPRYVVMENVKGILFFRLGGEQAGIHRIEGGISRGIVKLIKRLLTALKYDKYLCP